MLAAALSLAVATTDTTALAPCESLAAQVRSVAADAAAFGDAIKPGGDILAPLVVRAVPEVENPKWAAPAALALRRSGDSYVRFEQLDARVWRAWTVSGTLRCVDDLFFTVGADGALEQQAAPPPDGDLCWTHTRNIGRVAGAVALIETDALQGGYVGEAVTVTPWAGRWGEPCRVTFSYSDRFEVAEAFCLDEEPCRTGAPLAARLAEAFERNGNAEALAAVAPAENVADPETLIAAVRATFSRETGGQGALATFGATPQTEFPDYSGSDVMVVVDLGGAPVVAHVGVGGVGWRPIGDHLVTLYQGALPVAGFVVRQRLTGVREVKVFRPPPPEPRSR